MRRLAHVGAFGRSARLRRSWWTFAGGRVETQQERLPTYSSRPIATIVSLESARTFCRGGLRDDRRRRLLTDELAHSENRPVEEDRTGARIAPSRQKSENYGNGEFLGQQWRLHDFIPRRWFVLTAVLLVLAAIAGTMVGGYAWLNDRIPADHAMPRALQIDSKGSLACWFSSLVLLTAAIVSLLIYTVRKHRVNDYQGRYRIWFWAAGCWFLLAADKGASLGEAISAGVTAVTGTPLKGNGVLWETVPYLFVLGIVGSRLLLDMLPDRFSVGLLLAAAIVAGLVMVDRLGLFFVVTDARAIVYRIGGEMGSQLLLLAAVSYHARYVLLDAEGRRPCRNRVAADSAGVPSKELAPGETRPCLPRRAVAKTDPPHSMPPPHPSTSGATASFPGATASASQNSKLSKGERKALKERLLRERQQREQRGAA